MLATLVERESGEALPLPTALVQRYGGELRFPQRTPFVYANFVSTIDGVVSYDVPGKDSAAIVSEGYAGDQFMLALLRAVADAVIVGAGTLRKEPKSVWTAESVFPDAATEFAQLRRALRRPLAPTTIIATGSGEIDLRMPAFTSGVPVIVATSEQGARRIGATPSNVSVRALAATGMPSAEALVTLAARECGPRVLTEGGPRLLASFLDAGAVHELFLTIAPRLAGRTEVERRVALLEGKMFTPEAAPRGRLVSVKVADDYLFTRFAFA